MGVLLACMLRLCPQRAIHGHSLLPLALGLSSEQVCGDYRSRHLALEVCTTVFLHQDGSHPAQPLATCPPQRGKDTSGARCAFEAKPEDGQQSAECSWVCENALSQQHSLGGLRDLWERGAVEEETWAYFTVRVRLRPNPEELR